MLGLPQPSPQFSQFGTLSPLLMASSAGSPLIQSPIISNFPSPASVNSQDQLGYGVPPLKRARTSQSASRRGSVAPAPIVLTWNHEIQLRFAAALARTTASCGFPYSWVENPEFIAFLAEFLPSAIPISRRQLSNTYIPAEVAKIRAIARASSEGTLATLQSDGWSGINFHHFLAFMITTHKREVSYLFQHFKFRC